MSSGKADHLDEIDVLRGIVILLVLLSSYVTRYQAAFGHTGDLSAVPGVGFLALQLFLALSGYRLLLELETMRHAGAYVQARLLRYLPALWAAIPLACLAGWLAHVPAWRAPITAIPANLLMAADLVGAPVIDPSFWRLKIELLASATLGALWFACGRRMPPILLLAALALESALTQGADPARQHVLSVTGALTFDFFLPPCAFGLAVYQLRSAPRSFAWWSVAFAATVMLPMINTPDHAAVVAGAMAVFALAACGGLVWVRSWRALIWLGQMSYPIYVVHQIPGFAIIHGLEQAGIAPVLAILAAGAAAVSCGTVVHYLVERPARAHAPGLVARIGAAVMARSPVWTAAGFLPIRPARPKGPVAEW